MGGLFGLQLARVLLFGLFTYYAIEHPYGHHFTVGTPADSSTAFRGESVYRYFLRTAPQDYQTAWAIEKDRLDKLGLPTMTWRNRLIQGWLAEAALVLFVFAVSGFLGLFWFLVAVFNAHFGYKLGTYSQHYGIVRVPGSEIKAHHSWDSFNRVTNWFVDNIGRHSQHHLDLSASSGGSRTCMRRACRTTWATSRPLVLPSSRRCGIAPGHPCCSSGIGSMPHQRNAGWHTRPICAAVDPS